MRSTPQAGTVVAVRWCARYWPGYGRDVHGEVTVLVASGRCGRRRSTKTEARMYIGIGTLIIIIILILLLT